MKSERFFHFVHSLTKSQKAAFSRFNKGKERFLDTELYNRILAEPTFSKEAEARIRKGKFEKAGQYFYYRKKIGRKILLCLVLLDDKEPTTCGLIRQAAKMGAVDLANDIASDEYKELANTEDFISLSHLVETCKEVSYKYKTTIELPDKSPSLRTLNQRKEKIDNLRSLIDEIRKSVLLSDEKKFAIIQRTQNQLNKITPGCKSETFLWNKVNASIAILAKDYLSAYRIQEELISLEAWGLAINSEIIEVNELFRRIILASIIGYRDKALANLFQLRRVKYKDHGTKIFLHKRLAIMHIDLGEKYGNTDYVNYGLTLIEEDLSSFSDDELIRIYFFAGLTQFYNSNFKNALSCLKTVYAFHSKYRTVITWEPEALESLIHLEMGAIDELDESIIKATKVAKKTEKQYPVQVVNAIKRISHLSISEKASFLRQSLIEIEQTKSRIDEVQVSRYWDFTKWIKAQLSFNSYIDLINSEVALEKERFRESSS